MSRRTMWAAPSVTALTLYYAAKLNPAAWTFLAVMTGLSLVPAGKVGSYSCDAPALASKVHAELVMHAAMAGLQIPLGVDHLAQVSCCDHLLASPDHILGSVAA